MARMRRESPVRGLPDPAQHVSGQGSAYLLEGPWYGELESDSVNSKLRTRISDRFPKSIKGPSIGDLTSSGS